MSLSVLYVVPPTKTYAGIERVVDEICTELAEARQPDVQVDVLYTSHFSDHPIENTKYGKIQTDTGSLTGSIGAVRRAAKAKRYDLIVVPQVEATVMFWLACLGTGRKFVLYLHGNPNLEMQSFKSRLLFFLMEKIVLHRLSGVFGTSPKQLESFRKVFPSRIPHHWVPNPVRKFADTEQTNAWPNTVTFVNVGRFSHQKGQDILLSAFAKLRAMRKNVRLKIVGYGAGESALRDAMKRLGVGESVAIEHFPHNPQSALRSSDVYVSTSRWEGWSLAICEALRFGLPVVATDCDFGPSDILVDARLGRLVPNANEDELVGAMLYYCDQLQSEKAHSNYRKDFIDRYSVEKVVHVHAEALSHAAA